MKKCLKCNKDKQETDFYKDSHSTTGLQSRCKDCQKKASSKYREKHPEKVKKATKLWIKSHTEDLRLYYRRKREDLNYRIASNLRRRVSHALKGNVKKASVSKSFGISNLMDHIKTTLLEGMTENNYGNRVGQWSVDHIIPLSKFDLTDPEQVKKANHYTNLRAMWHVDNVKKSNK